jgi:hypothetical protein
MAIGFDLAEALELADAVIDVHDEVPRLELGEIAEEAGSANLTARPLQRWRDFEQVRVAEQRDVRIGKGHAFGKRRPDQ